MSNPHAQEPAPSRNPRGRPRKPTYNHALGDMLIEAAEELAAHARGERPLEAREIATPARTPDVVAIRRRTGLTQEQFASRFGFTLAALRSWEQGRRPINRTAEVLLRVIAHEPDAVERSLAHPA